jgi:hypothetical protein
MEKLVFVVEVLKYASDFDKNVTARKEKIRLKFLNVLARQYFEYGDVESLTQFFAVVKGDEDIRMVYNGTSSIKRSPLVSLVCTCYCQRYVEGTEARD